MKRDKVVGYAIAVVLGVLVAGLVAANLHNIGVGGLVLVVIVLAVAAYDRFR
jgi:hypothetical protein